MPPKALSFFYISARFRFDLTIYESIPVKEPD